MKTVLNKLNNISEVSSTNEKVELLKQYLNDSLFSKVVYYALTGSMNFHMTKLGKMTYSSGVSNEEIFNTLYRFCKSRGVSKEDKEYLTMISSANAETYEVVNRIVSKDLKCGVSSKLVNKALPGLIEITPYQRCSSLKNINRIKFPALAQTKADGMFSYASTGFLVEVFKTRRGREFHLFDILEQHVARLTKNNDVLVGELLILGEDGFFLDRKTGNGLLNKFIKGTGSVDIAKRVRYKVWDVLTMNDYTNHTSNTPCGDRFNRLVELFNDYNSDVISIVNSKRVDSYEEALSFYKGQRDKGEEGAIIKDLSSVWKNNTCPTIVKMKNVSTAEFEIIGVNYGKRNSKYENMMGSLTIASSDRKIICNVGSGFSDDERNYDYWKEHIGDIISVDFERVISDKHRDTHKLFLPVFNETRFHDKESADSLTYVNSL